MDSFYFGYGDFYTDGDDNLSVLDTIKVHDKSDVANNVEDAKKAAVTQAMEANNANALQQEGAFRSVIILAIVAYIALHII